MINLGTLITSIQSLIANDTYLNNELGGQVTLGEMSQQNTILQTVMPYCVIYCIGPGEQIGNFGDNFLDTITLQFTIFTISSITTSDIIYSLALLFNHANVSVGTNERLVRMNRSSSVRIVSAGQDQNDNYIYMGSVDFDIQVGGC